MLAHELVEQQHRQENKFTGMQGYDAGHEKGLKAESRITGYHRNEARSTEKNGVVSLVYYNRSEGYKVVTITMSNNNFTSVDEQ